MMMESDEKEPQLPENTTAQQLLDEYSDKARAEIAQAQGISAAMFNRYLNARARSARVAASVSQAKEILQNKPAPAERNGSEILAESAVVRGLTEVITLFGPEHLSEAEIDKLERQAYVELEEFEASPHPYLFTREGKKLERMFKRVVETRTQNEIKKHIEAGLSDADARKAAVESLREQEKRTNLRILRYALESMASKFAEAHHPWEGRETREMSELQSIVSNYGKRPLAARESELLAAFVKAAKTHYFNRAYPDHTHVLWKYRRMFDTVFAAYKNHGPHKRTSSNVSGPSEVFTSHQSEREAGYRRVGKARPHRDTSGGSGENW
jgi:hypothetical protein